MQVGIRQAGLAPLLREAYKERQMLQRLLGSKERVLGEARQATFL